MTQSTDHSNKQSALLYYMYACKCEWNRRNFLIRSVCFLLLLLLMSFALRNIAACSVRVFRSSFCSSTFCFFFSVCFIYLAASSFSSSIIFMWNYVQLFPPIITNMCVFVSSLAQLCPLPSIFAIFSSIDDAFFYLFKKKKRRIGLVLRSKNEFKIE